MPNYRQQLLEEAIKITSHDRNKEYGSPEDNFRNIAGLWNAYLIAQGKAAWFNRADVAIMMILMKVARLATNPKHHDSAVDIAGYAACLADVQEAMKAASFKDQVVSQPTQEIEGVKFSNSLEPDPNKFWRPDEKNSQGLPD